jgi:hypothetical protein
LWTVGECAYLHKAKAECRKLIHTTSIGIYTRTNAYGVLEAKAEDIALKIDLAW